MQKLILGLPKGSLEETTFSLMEKAGFNISKSGRSYMPTIDDEGISIRLIRAQEMAHYVEKGLLDAGITGYDWIVENNSQVHEVCELLYAKQGMRPVRWVLAVPNDSPITRPEHLEGKRIATEAVGIASRYLAGKGIHAEVEFSWGATEVKAPELVDAIIDLTETGNSLRANNLRIVDTVLQSTTRLIANPVSWKDSWKRAKIEQIAMLLGGALSAESKVVLKMNIPEAQLDKIIAVLPAMMSPTVGHLTTPGWLSVETVMEEKQVRDLIPRLKEAGATGIIELGLNKVIP